jgi:two-component system, cell cycle response regulator DivK
MTSILFVDDDALALQLMSKVTSLLGYQAIISTSADIGLTLAADEQPALILVDLNMDDMDGSEFVRRLRLSPKISHLPVLIYSAADGFKEEELARQVGANGFLRKPVGLNELSQVIRAYAEHG